MLCGPDFDPTLSKSPTHTIILYACMKGFSLDRFRAEWETGLGMRLFRALEDCDSPEASSRAFLISDRERLIFRFLYDQAGGWWEWLPGDKTARFFPAQAWETMLGAMK